MPRDPGEVRLQPVQIGPEQPALVQVLGRLGPTAEGLVEQVQIERGAQQVAQAGFQPLEGQGTGPLRTAFLAQRVSGGGLLGGEGTQFQVGGLLVVGVAEAGEEAGVGQDLGAVL